MTLRNRILLYIVIVHVALGAAAVAILLERPMLLFAVEAAFVLSVVVGVRLVRALFVPLDLIQTGAELIAERDFTSRFVSVGQPEMDSLIDVYNRMIDRLRDERLAAEERHHLLQKIFEASPSGIVICDFDGNVERMNEAARRYGRDDVRPLLEGIPMNGSRLVSHHGARRLRVSRAEFRDRGFAKSFYVLEEMTEELRLSEKAAYEKLIRMMSHEVNNSVGAVRSLLESLLRYAPQVGEKDRSDFESALNVASARVDALNRFMSGFADVVRIPPPNRSLARLSDVAKRTIALLAPELYERAIRIDAEITDQSEYRFDVGQMEQVLLNVMRNAMEAVGREGSITVSLREGVLTVADSGPGIAQEVRGELFTPFFTTKRNGNGIGLTIVQEILANHGFAFSLENGAKGGAEFRIVL